MRRILQTFGIGAAAAFPTVTFAHDGMESNAVAFGHSLLHSGPGAIVLLILAAVSGVVAVRMVRARDR